MLVDMRVCKIGEGSFCVLITLFEKNKKTFLSFFVLNKKQGNLTKTMCFVLCVL